MASTLPQQESHVNESRPQCTIVLVWRKSVICYEFLVFTSGKPTRSKSPITIPQRLLRKPNQSLISETSHSQEIIIPDRVFVLGAVEQGSDHDGLIDGFTRHLHHRPHPRPPRPLQPPWAQSSWQPSSSFSCSWASQWSPWPMVVPESSRSRHP